MNPTKRITDPTFKYVPAANTDIRKLFERVKREQAQTQVKKNIAQFGKDAREIWEECELRAVKQIGGNHEPR